MRKMKRLLAGLACVLMLCGLMAPAYADGGSYTIAYTNYAYAIDVSYGGFTVNEELGDENYVSGYMYIHGSMRSGGSFTINVTWNSDDGSGGYTDDRVVYISGWNEEIEEGAFLWNGEAKDEELDWVTVTSRTTNGITFEVTDPTELQFDEICVSIQGPNGPKPIDGGISTNIYVYLEYDTVQPSFQDDTVTQTAAPDAGEDEGTAIRPDIVETPRPSGGTTDRRDEGTSTAAKVALSLGGALAAAGALGAASGGNKKGGEEEEKKKKTYKMKVYKNFGDGIRRGAMPVTVWARIVEVVDGEEINRPDLSEKITVSGTGMDVRPLGMQNTYMGAEVSIPADSEAQTATLTFTYTGAGGVFRSNITFKVLGEPEITFPDVTEDGKHWDVNYEISRVDMVSGAGGKDRLRFVITNTTEEPKAIRFKDHEGYDIAYEKDTQWQFTYYACIENRTAPIEKENGIFAYAKVTKVRVEAEFADGRVIWNIFSIWLYPEGLAAQGELTNGRLTVNTVPRDNPTDGYAKIAPTVFSLTLAYPDGNGKAVTVDQPSFSCGKFTDDGKYGELFLVNFDYDIKHRSSSGIAFYPENTLPSLGDPYEARLPIAVEDEEGRRYAADLPMAIIGEEPKPVYSDADRQRELALLKKDIRWFGLSANPDVTNMVRLATSGLASVDDIQDARKAVIHAAVVFYRDCRDAYRGMDQLLTKYIVIAGTMVKAGDYALEYILKAKLGGYGGLAANIINPLKNLFATFIGEIYADGGANQDPLYYVEKFSKTLLKGCEDALYSAISGTLFGSDDFEQETYVPFRMGGKNMALTGNAAQEIQKVLGYVISVYIMIRFIDHYFNGKENEKGDVVRSMAAACSDLTFKLLKDFVMGLIAKAFSRFFELIGKCFGNFLKKFCQSQVNAAAQKAAMKSFEHQIKQGYTADGKLTDATLDAARTVKEFAKKLLISKDNRNIEAIANLGKDVWDSKLLGSILNAMLGKREDPDEGYELKSTGDFVIEKGQEKLEKYIRERFGVKADEVIYEGIESWISRRVNPLEVDLQLKDGKLILGLLGYQVHILLSGENFLAITEMIFETIFSWLDAYWDMLVNTVTVPDPRKQVEKNIDRVRQELEEQKTRMESLEDVEFVYTGK